MTLFPCLKDRCKKATKERIVGRVQKVQVKVGKACAKASALRRLRKFISQDVMVRLYKAYVLPHLEYCSPLLLGVGNVEASKMESTRDLF